MSAFFGGFFGAVFGCIAVFSAFVVIGGSKLDDQMHDKE